MRLKEIKPGMAIHCKNYEEKKALLEEAERLGYKWSNTCAPTDSRMVKIAEMTIHFYGKSECANFKHITWSDKTKGVTEFSDLIMPEMTADELLNILNEIVHCEGRSCDDCPLQEKEGNLCTKDVDAVKISNPDKLISICQQWKSSHEKKEPEIEWVYRVFGSENYGEKFFQTEEEAIKRCEELAKSQKTKQYARYERVCRVKVVE